MPEVNHPAEYVDLVIIGAGPAGLFAALRLAGRLGVLLIDRKSYPGGRAVRQTAS